MKAGALSCCPCVSSLVSSLSCDGRFYFCCTGGDICRVYTSLWTSVVYLYLHVRVSSHFKLNPDSMTVIHSVHGLVFQTCKSKCTRSDLATCLHWETPCSWAVRPVDVLLPAVASLCTGVCLVLAWEVSFCHCSPLDRLSPFSPEHNPRFVSSVTKSKSDVICLHPLPVPSSLLFVLWH